MPVIYAAGTLSLAMLERLVQRRNLGQTLLVEAEAPAELAVEDLMARPPPNWRALGSPKPWRRGKMARIGSIPTSSGAISLGAAGGELFGQPSPPGCRVGSGSDRPRCLSGTHGYSVFLCLNGSRGHLSLMVPDGGVRRASVGDLAASSGRAFAAWSAGPARRRTSSGRRSRDLWLSGVVRRGRAVGLSVDRRRRSVSTTEVHSRRHSQAAPIACAHSGGGYGASDFAARRGGGRPHPRAPQDGKRARTSARTRPERGGRSGGGLGCGLAGPRRTWAARGPSDPSSRVRRRVARVARPEVRAPGPRCAPSPRAARRVRGTV